MWFDDEIPLFLDTNLGTHFALSVPHDITAGDLKGKLGVEHLSCFPNLGKIKVHGLMVKKKSFFYHLSDSMPIKHVFEGAPKTWLLHLHASSNLSLLNYEGSSSVADEEQAEMCFSNDSNIIKHRNRVEDNRLAENREVKVTLGPNFRIEQKCKDYNIDENCKENLNGKESSEAISVTGIISRFFTDLDEVDSCYHRPKHPSEIESMHKNNVIDLVTQCSVAGQKDEKKAERGKATLKKVKKRPIVARKLVGRKSLPGYVVTSSSQSCKFQVGKRLVQAANSIQSRKGSGAMFLSMCRNMITRSACVE